MGGLPVLSSYRDCPSSPLPLELKISFTSFISLDQESLVSDCWDSAPASCHLPEHLPVSAGWKGISRKLRGSITDTCSSPRIAPKLVGLLLFLESRAEYVDSYVHVSIIASGVRQLQDDGGWPTSDNTETN